MSEKQQKQPEGIGPYRT